MTKVVQRGGLTPQTMDRARVEQLLRGAVEADMMLLQLRLRERKENPPSFLTLLNKIKEAEGNKATRHKIKATVKSIQTPEEDKIESSAVRQLRAELQELRSRVEVNATNVSASAMSVEYKDKLSIKTADTHGESEVQALKQQVQQLQQKIAVMSINSSSPALHMTKPRALHDRERQVKPKADYFCYCCGEDGHFATRCKAPENTAQVI